MSDITTSELIAVSALLELQAEVRVKDTGDDDKCPEKVETPQLIPSTSGTSSIEPNAEPKPGPSNPGSSSSVPDDASSEPSTSKQPSQKSSSNRPALCPKRLKLYNSRQRRAKRVITKRSIGAQSDVSLQVATLDTVQCLLKGLYSRVKSWLVESDQETSDDDDDEI